MARYGPESFKLKNADTVTIRHCSPSDAGKFQEFQQQIARETTNTMQVQGTRAPEDKVRENWLMNECDPKYLRLGVFDNTSLIGQLSFWPVNPNHPWLGHIGGFAMMILEKYWGQGIGTKLIQIMEEHARSCGLTRLEAMVRTENERGIRLYVNCGFILEGTRYSAALIDGHYQNEYYLGKILANKAPTKEWRPPPLETKHLSLRALEQSDAESIFEYAQNPNVSLYTLWNPHQTIADSVDFIVNYAHANYRSNIPEPFAITLKQNPDRVIGSVGCFWHSKPSQVMELAYALAEPYWGKGLTVEAVTTVIDYCFENFEVNRIQARCKIENKASVRVMEKLRMTYEGTLKSALFHRNRSWDVHYYSLLKDQWLDIDKS